MPEQRIASYGRSRGRKLKTEKRRLLSEVLSQVGIAFPEEEARLSPAAFFDHPYAEYWLEIGFGSGEHLAQQARQHAGTGCIGCEPYLHGMGNLLREIEQDGLTNIRVYSGDARDLAARLPEASIRRVFILYPDPWPKARHHKRRLISMPFIAEIARIIPEGGALMLATDHADYLTWMLERMLASPDFEWTAKGPDDWHNPPAGWIPTRFEQKAVAQGRVPTYLMFRRR